VELNIIYRFKKKNIYFNTFTKRYKKIRYINFNYYFSVSFNSFEIYNIFIILFYFFSFMFFLKIYFIL